MTTTKEIIRDAATNLMEMFQSGKMPQAVAWTVVQRQQGDIQPSHSWSIGNQILMLLQGTDDARGFKQWSDVGRYIKKGAKAIHILAPITKTIDDPKKPGEKIKILNGFKAVPVFRYQETEGKPLLKAVYTPPVPPPFFEVANYLGLTIKYSPAVSNYLGKYNRLSGQITLCAEDSIVLYHELAHAVHDLIVPPDSIDTARGEIVAEMSACILCELQNIRGYQQQTYDYIKYYCRDKDPVGVVKAILSLLNEIELVVSKILTTAEDIDRLQEAKISS